MMTSEQFVFCLTLLFVGKIGQKIHLTSSLSLSQESAFISVHVGDKVTLKCFYEDPSWFHWYIQHLGEKPELISTFHVYSTEITFYGQFNSPRFTLDTENGNHHLTISDVKFSDSATYYCAARSAMVVHFAEGSTVSVKDSDLNIQTLIHQSSTETIQPGGSVTLNCTVQTGTCDGEHSVYWFKDSAESHAGLLYTHGGIIDQCERNPNTHTHTCVYDLVMKDLNVSHAGTYYCAVVSCGHILFGNGTKLDFNGEVDFDVLVYVLTGTLIFTIIFVIVLMYKISIKNLSAEQRFPDPLRANTMSTNQDTESPQYAALDLNQTNRSRRQRSNKNNDCVYSSVRQQS